MNTRPGKCKDPFPKTSLDRINCHDLELIFNLKMGSHAGIFIVGI